MLDIPLTEDDRKRTERRKKTEYQRRWRAAHREKNRAYCRGYRQKNHAREMERNRKYRETHREQQREHARRYSATHKEQERERNRRYHEANREKLKAARREYHRRTLYGLPLGRFEVMLTAQNGLCACCGLPPASKRRWHIDHDHQTGAVRALLCGNCNVGIAQFKESIDRLRLAIEYLQRYATPSLSAPTASSARL